MSILARINSDKMKAKLSQKKLKKDIAWLAETAELDSIGRLDVIADIRTYLEGFLRDPPQEWLGFDDDVQVLKIFAKHLKVVLPEMKTELATTTKLIPLLVTLQHEVAMVGFDDNKRETTDPEAIKVLKKFIKNNNDTIGIMLANQTDYMGASQTTKERDLRTENHIIESYLPQQLSTDELTDVIFACVEDHPEFKMGDIMKWLKANNEGLYDGKEASSIIRDALNG